MSIDYNVVVNMIADIVKQALPIGIIFILSERLVQMFLKFAFPKMFKGGIQLCILIMFLIFKHQLLILIPL